jgi:membrane protein
MAFLKGMKIFTLLGKAFGKFRENDPLRMAGATAFFTTFALPAVLIILIQVFGLIISPRFMTHQLLQNLAGVIGSKSTADLHKTLIHVRHFSRNWLVTAGGFLFLIFVATTLFKVIKDSMNQLWNIKVEDHAGIAFNLLNRVKSFIVILITGILFMAVLLAEGLLNLLSQSINDQFHGDGLFLNSIIKQVISIVVVTSWFTMMFKFLPDGRPSWKVAITGAFFTGLLFTFGKWLLQWLLSYSNMQTIYGASASSVLLLLFVFYSSFIFYYGACFTKVWADDHKQPIQPGIHALKYVGPQVEGEKVHDLKG